VIVSAHGTIIDFPVTGQFRCATLDLCNFDTKESNLCWFDGFCTNLCCEKANVILTYCVLLFEDCRL